MAESMDEISKKLLAAKQGILWAPHPLIRRVPNKAGVERLQQLWLSNANQMDWRDVPLFTLEGEYVNEGDTAINVNGTPGELDRSEQEGPAVPASPIQP